MEAILSALAAQHAELDTLLAPLDHVGWATPVPRCPGWTVADVVLHMAQTDETARLSAEGQNLRMIADSFAENAGRVDDAAATAVESERGLPVDVLLARWRDAAAAERAAFAACNLSDRVEWVAGNMAARTLATTRLSECWIHTGDIAHGLGVPLPATDRLWHIARLAWRTLPYAFARAGRELKGAVAAALTAPSGVTWGFTPDEPAVTTLTGEAEDFCMVAARRYEPADTSLIANGPDADAVLALVRTYA